jgi:glycosyltransferase involved in cell wall biosynthesis
MDRRRVLMVSFDLSNNSLGRVAILANALSRYFEVGVLGPATKGVVWEPLADDRSLTVTMCRPADCLRRLLTTDADVVYAVKPVVNSFALSLAAKQFNHRPLILDVDDWEWGFCLDYLGSRRARLRSARRVTDPNNLCYVWALDRLACVADRITVSNRFLQRRFGGELIPHFRDTVAFDPDRYDHELCKRELGLGGRKVVLFLGTPRRHKGLEQLAEAIRRLGRPDVTLLIVGASDEQAGRLPHDEFVTVLGQQPFHDIPRFLAAADVVALFQTLSPSTLGQVPAKVFDAMAMARPVVASAVSDLPEILDGCGELVEAGDVDALTRAIGSLLDDPRRAAELGRRARRRCVERYSVDAVAPALRRVVLSCAPVSRRRGMPASMSLDEA